VVVSILIRNVRYAVVVLLTVTGVEGCSVLKIQSKGLLANLLFGLASKGHDQDTKKVVRKIVSSRS